MYGHCAAGGVPRQCQSVEQAAGSVDRWRELSASCRVPHYYLRGHQPATWRGRRRCLQLPAPGRRRPRGTRLCRRSTGHPGRRQLLVFRWGGCDSCVSRGGAPRRCARSASNSQSRMHDEIATSEAGSGDARLALTTRVGPRARPRVESHRARSRVVDRTLTPAPSDARGKLPRWVKKMACAHGGVQGLRACTLRSLARSRTVPGRARHPALHAAAAAAGCIRCSGCWHH